MNTILFMHNTIHLHLQFDPWQNSSQKLGIQVVKFNPYVWPIACMWSISPMNIVFHQFNILHHEYYLLFHPSCQVFSINISSFQFFLWSMFVWPLPFPLLPQKSPLQKGYLKVSLGHIRTWPYTTVVRDYSSKSLGKLKAEWSRSTDFSIYS
jgi:hypothetical protein